MLDIDYEKSVVILIQLFSENMFCQTCLNSSGFQEYFFEFLIVRTHLDSSSRDYGRPKR